MNFSHDRSSLKKRKKKEKKRKRRDDTLLPKFMQSIKSLRVHWTRSLFACCSIFIALREGSRINNELVEKSLDTSFLVFALIHLSP